MSVARIGVSPPAEFVRHRWLFTALEAAYSVAFEPCGGGISSELAGVVAIGTPHSADACPVPILSVAGSSYRHTGESTIQMSMSPKLHRALRGRRLRETAAGEDGALDARGCWHVLAESSGRPVWATRVGVADRYASAIALPRLVQGERLRDHLRPGNFMALLPLVDFVRRISGDAGWHSPPLRAAVVLDDPNLHWPSYGHLNFERLSAHAREHDYHAVIATIPLDGFAVHPAAARPFRAHPDRVSLAVHGNDHVHHELEISDRAHAQRIAAQAMARAATLERHVGVSVSRVMVPPHERASACAIAGLFDAGFEGICSAATIQDRDGVSPAGALGDWGLAQLLEGGFPLLARRHLSEHPEDLVLRAYLGQPLILYGHHSDAAGGLARLAAVADSINSVQPVEWASLEHIARTNYLHRIEGRRLDVRLFTLRAFIELPAGATELRLTWPVAADAGRELKVTVRGVGAMVTALTSAQARSCSFELPPGPARGVWVQVTPLRTLGTSGGRPRRLWPVCRRVLTESRDRSAPLVDAARRRGAAAEPDRVVSA